MSDERTQGEPTPPAPAPSPSNDGPRTAATTFIPSRGPRENPRRVRDGIRLKDADGLLAEDGPYVGPWLRLLPNIVSEDERHEGLAYATAGQIMSLEVREGGAAARVQGRQARPYRVQLIVPVFGTVTWDALIRGLASETGLVASLLSGEMPDLLEQYFRDRDATLVPEAMAADAVRCTCEHPAPCRHVAAVWYLVADRFRSDAGAILQLRGMERPVLVEQLRQMRAIHTRGVAAAHADPLIPESRDEPAALDSCLDGFWRAGADVGRVADTPPATYAPQALLRRLGPSPLSGRFPLVGLLASVYETVARDAVAMRDEIEDLDGPR